MSQKNTKTKRRRCLHCFYDSERNPCSVCNKKWFDKFQIECIHKRSERHLLACGRCGSPSPREFSFFFVDNGMSIPWRCRCITETGMELDRLSANLGEQLLSATSDDVIRELEDLIMRFIDTSLSSRLCDLITTFLKSIEACEPELSCPTRGLDVTWLKKKHSSLLSKKWFPMLFNPNADEQQPLNREYENKKGQRRWEMCDQETPNKKTKRKKMELEMEFY